MGERKTRFFCIATHCNLQMKVQSPNGSSIQPLLLHPFCPLEAAVPCILRASSSAGARIYNSCSGLDHRKCGHRCGGAAVFH